MMFNTLTIIAVMILLIIVYISAKIHESEEKEMMTLNMIFNGHHEEDLEEDEDGYLISREEIKREEMKKEK